MEPILVRARGRWAGVAVLLAGLALLVVMLAAPLALAEPAETTLTMGATPTTIDWAQPWALTGELTSGGAAIPDASVDLQASIDNGDTWATLEGLVPAAGTSTYSSNVTGTYQKMQFRLFYAGDGVNYESSYSEPVTVTPRVKLGTPVAPASVAAGSKFTAYGSLKPQQPKGSKTVKIKCYLKKSGNWVLKKTVSATNADKGSATRYSARFSLGKGSWKLVAYSPATAKYAKTTSGNETLKAK
jgi:hypothetical protein